ncbi:RNA-directed DNA polymerase, partial [Leptospira wolffii]
ASINFLINLRKSFSYFYTIIDKGEYFRFKEQLRLYSELELNGNKNIPWKKLYSRKEEHAYFFAVTYLFTCSKLSEIVVFLCNSLLPIESEQWLPWRSSVFSFQIIGDKSIKLLERSYLLNIGFIRNDLILKSTYSSFKEELAINIDFAESLLVKTKGSQYFSITEVNFRNLIPLYENKSGEMKITLAPISYDPDKDLDKKSLRFNSIDIKRKLKISIDSAVEEAISRKSKVLILPEMTLPDEYIFYFLNKLAKN